MALDDGDYSIAQPDGPPRPGIPFSDNQIYVWEQDYQINRADFAPLALDTEYDEDANFVLVEETSPQHIGGGVVKWTRVYAKVPDQRDEYESFAYQFPGIVGGSLTADEDAARPATTKQVTSRLQFDYELTDTPSGIALETKFVVNGFSVGGVILPADGNLLSGLTDPTTDDYVNSLIGTEAVAEDSTLRRWRGNIWERVTRYVTLE